MRRIRALLLLMLCALPGPAVAALCGDLDGDEQVTASDIGWLRAFLADPDLPLPPGARDRCAVAEGSSGCGLLDLVVLVRALETPGAPPGLAPVCAVAGTDCRVTSSWPAAWSDFEDAVVALVNEARAHGRSCGGTWYPAASALALSLEIREAARCHSLDMGEGDFFSHTGSDGSRFWERMAAAGYAGAPRGEAIAAGYAAPEALVGGWLASSGHCSILMNGAAADLGVGFTETSGSSYQGLRQTLDTGR